MEWRTIPGFSRYSASEKGDIRRDVRIHNSLPGPISASLNDRGYYKTSLTDDLGNSRTVTVHTLVALAFLGQRPAGMVICHNDGVPTNIHYTNLRYDTPKSNTADSRSHKSMCTGSSHPEAKLKECDIPEIKRLWSEGRLRQKDIGALYGVSQRAIWQVIHGKKWKHVGAAA